MPVLTVRSFAEMIGLSAYQQQRVLLEQKYPKQTPQVFKIPFYSTSLKTIKSFYTSKNDHRILSIAISEIQKSSSILAKKENNIRVISTFAKSSQAKRKFKVLANQRYKVTLGTVNIKLSFDLTVDDSKNDKYLFYNFRNTPVDSELAKLSLEFAHYILKANGVITELKNLEFIDLVSNKVYILNKARKTSITKLKQNISIIEALWNTI